MVNNKKLTINNIEKLKGERIRNQEYIIDKIETYDDKYKIEATQDGFTPNRFTIVLRREMLECGLISTNVFWKSAWNSSSEQDVLFVQLGEMVSMSRWLGFMDKAVNTIMDRAQWSRTCRIIIS
jgi:hypothetical protein